LTGANGKVFLTKLQKWDQSEKERKNIPVDRNPEGEQGDKRGAKLSGTGEKGSEVLQKEDLGR